MINVFDRPYDRFADDLAAGEFRISPEEIACGQQFVLEITYIVGAGGISEGGGIEIETPGVPGWSRPQVEDSRGDDYLRIDTPRRKDIDLELSCHGWPRVFITSPTEIKDNARWIRAVVRGGSLNDGDAVTFGFGTDKTPDFGTQPAGADQKNVLQPIWFYLDAQGDGKYVRLANSPTIRLFASKPDKLYVTLPSIVPSGQSVTPRTAVGDAFGNPIDESVKLQIKGKGRFRNARPLKPQGRHPH